MCFRFRSTAARTTVRPAFVCPGKLCAFALDHQPQGRRCGRKIALTYFMVPGGSDCGFFFQADAVQSCMNDLHVLHDLTCNRSHSSVG